MIAVTIATPDYMHLASEQALSMSSHSGLMTHLILIPEARFEEAVAVKLELQRTFRGNTVLFFDADWRAIRPVDVGMLEKLSGAGKFVACQDPGIFDPAAFPAPDCKVFGIERLKYFNSGFWVANFANERHVLAFEKARELYEESKRGRWKEIRDYGEQSYLNAGVQMAGVEIELLPDRWNFFYHAFRWGAVAHIPRNIIGLHAAGSKLPEKMPVLNAQEMLFGMRMHDDVLPREPEAAG